jgi:hypothetical protein
MFGANPALLFSGRLIFPPEDGIISFGHGTPARRAAAKPSGEKASMDRQKEKQCEIRTFQSARFPRTG